VKSIYLVPVGTIDDDIIAAAESCIWHTFGIPVRCTKSMEIPPDAYDAKRQQFGSIEILRSMYRNVPEDAFRYFAVIDKDIFIPVLSFVYGHAQFEGTVGIVSLARLRQEFYGFPPNPELLLKRMLKEVVHEMGHLFGLTHCSDATCPMALSTNIRALDRKQVKLCESCTILLKENMVEKFS
jgi:archaemetzincin